MDASDAIKDYIKQKISRVKKFAPEPLEAFVVLSMQKHNHICDISIQSGGKSFKGSESSENLYSSIDLVIEKLQRQMRDSKKRNSRV